MTVKDKILSKSILHGRGVVSEVLYVINKGELSKVKVSNDIKILTVIDKGAIHNASLSKSNIINNEVEFIVIDKYIKWISKIEEMHKYISKHYDTLPKYILYLDGTDTLIINDIDNPKEILDYYNCKVSVPSK